MRRSLPEVLILCSLCRHEWRSTTKEIRRRKRLECPSCGARHATKKMYFVDGGRVDHYGTGFPLPERG